MNKNIIDNLDKLLQIYEQLPDKKFQLRALKNALYNIKKYEKEIVNGLQAKREISHIGSGLEKRIDEIIETNTLQEFQQYEAINKSEDINDLLDITGVGKVRAQKWWKMGIRNIDDVHKAIENKMIDTTHHIDIGIRYYDDFKLKIPREEIDRINNYLQKIIQSIDNTLTYEICGSYRRGALESGDIDVLITTPKVLKNISSKRYLSKIVDKLTEDKFIIDNLTIQGEKKYMGVCRIKTHARRIDIRMIDYKNAIAALVYFTGNKEFNIYVRNKAISMGYSLSEYGMTKLDDPNKELILFNSEKELFDFLKIEDVKPCDRNYN